MNNREYNTELSKPIADGCISICDACLDAMTIQFDDSEYKNLTEEERLQKAEAELELVKSGLGQVAHNCNEIKCQCACSSKYPEGGLILVPSPDDEEEEEEALGVTAE